MQNAESNSIGFKYKWHDETGASTGFRNGNGSFNGQTLKIGNVAINVDELAAIIVNENVFFLGFQNNDTDEFENANVEIYGTDVKQLKFAIDASRSAWAASQERERLAAVGELESYQDSICPFCKSTIILSGLPVTDQVFCEYCTTLHSRNRNEIGDVEFHFGICDGCGMYSRPREFAVFYFYFLFITFGFHHDSIVRCSGCMRRSSWKMVFGNMLGILGVPFALLQLYRSYSTKKLTGIFAGLDDANSLARNGKIELALEKYDLIMDNVPENAGVKYNIATGFVVKQDFENAVEMFELSLDDCSNYWPSVHGLMMCLHRQGKNKELAAVKTLWNLDTLNDGH